MEYFSVFYDFYWENQQKISLNLATILYNKIYSAHFEAKSASQLILIHQKSLPLVQCLHPFDFNLKIQQFQFIARMQKYQVLERIGEGAYGVVLKCRCNDVDGGKSRGNADKKDRQIVAMKQFKQGDDNQIVRKTTMREVKILKMLDHPNIVQLRQAFRKRGVVYLIFEYVRNNLLEVLEKSPDGLEHERIKQIIFSLVKGLAYLHSMNIIHRDIKPQNLLIGDENQLKICDFGFARVQKKVYKEPLTDYVATRWYRPPQLLVGAHYGKQIDMWAVGCIMGELIDGNPMFPGENQLDQLFLIQKCLGPLTPQHHEIFLKNPRFVGTRFPDINTLQTIDKRYLGKFTPKGLNFLKQLMKMDPSQRLTAQEALSHPFFEGLDQSEQITRRMSSTIRNQSKFIERDELIQTTGVNTVTQQRRKNYSNAATNQIGIYGEKQREKTENSSMGDHIFVVNKPPQKLNIGKKKKEDNFMTTKGMSNYSSTNGSKSLGKSKISTKTSHASNNSTSHNNNRHASIEKGRQNRETLTKTQTGFYIAGGGVIQQKLQEEQESNFYKQPTTNHTRNKIYNVRSPKSRNNYRKSNLNTQEILEDVHEGEVNQSSSQLPILVLATQKSGEHRTVNPIHQMGHQNSHLLHNVHHQKPIVVHHHTNAPNILITNSTFNYRH